MFSVVVLPQLGSGLEVFLFLNVNQDQWVFFSATHTLHSLVLFTLEVFTSGISHRNIFLKRFNVGPGTGYYSIHGDRNGEGIFETLWAGICCSDSILFLCSFGLVDFDVGKIIVIYKFWFSGSNHIKFWFILALGVLPILDSNAWLIGLGCLAICEGNNGSGPRKLLPLYCLNGKWHVCRRKAL